MILMIDNYDSFTYNIVQYLGELGEQVEVYRNDEISLDEISELNPDRMLYLQAPVRRTKLASPWMLFANFPV